MCSCSGLRLAEGQGAALRAAVAQGHATRWLGDDPAPAQAPEAPGVAALTAGLRHDRHERFGHEWSPRLYAVWRAAPGWVVKGGLGHGFKAPTLRRVRPLLGNVVLPGPTLVAIDFHLIRPEFDP